MNYRVQTKKKQQILHSYRERHRVSALFIKSSFSIFHEALKHNEVEFSPMKGEGV